MSFGFLYRYGIFVLFLIASFPAIEVDASEGKQISFEKIILKESQLYTYGMAIADFDKDGDLDISLSQADDLFLRGEKNSPGDRISWFENIGNKQFKEWLIYHSDQDKGWFEYQKAIDIDRDGFLDILVVKNNNFGCKGCGGGDIIWFKNPGNFNTKPLPWKRFKITSEFRYAYDLDIEDIDNDGYLDIVATQYKGHPYLDGNSVSWFKNPNDTVENTEWQQFDIDGKYDGPFSRFIKKRIDRYRENGYFEKPYLDETLSARIADFNNDNKPDVVVTAFGSSVTAWYQNINPKWNKWQKHIISRNVRPGHATSVDMDCDGDIDVVVPYGALSSRVRGIDSKRLEKKIVWFENIINETGKGTGWKEHTITSINNGWFDVSAADMDNDGDMDIAACAFRKSGGVYLFEQKVNKQWKLHVIENNLQSPSKILTSDLNNDGQIDIVVASSSPKNRLIVWMQK